MKMKLSPASELHKTLRLELLEVLRKYTGKLDSSEMLALSAYMVGQILAMQDQRKMTPAMGMNLIASNIELGNKHAIDSLLGTPEGVA